MTKTTEWDKESVAPCLSPSRRVSAAVSARPSLRAALGHLLGQSPQPTAPRQLRTTDPTQHKGD